MGLELALWASAFVACGSFFAWLTRAVVKNREALEREHRALRAGLILQRSVAKGVGVPVDALRAYDTWAKTEGMDP